MILRDTTERPEVLECGVGKLVGHSGEHLERLLEESMTDQRWFDVVNSVENPFGKGDAGERIASAIEKFLRTREDSLL